MRKGRRWARAALFIVGLGVGLGLGVGVSWGLLPRMPRYADLSQLENGYKEDIILMTGVAYGQDGDLELAQERLSLLGERDISRRVAALTEKAIAAGALPQTRRGLARLAFALGEKSSAIMAYVATPIRTPTATPFLAPASATPTPSLGRTPTASDTPTRQVAWRIPTTTRPIPTPRRLGAGFAVAYVLDSQQRLAGEENVSPGYILIDVIGPGGEGLPGVRINIEWEGGSDIAMTGLHPDRMPGYADYQMIPGTVYTVSVAGAQSERPIGLMVSPEQSTKAPPESWQVVFVRRP